MIDLENKLKSIFKKHKVIFAYLFGSRAAGKVGGLSDIDIAVYFEHTISPRERQRIRFEIEEDIEKKLNLPEKVDVIPLNEAQPLLEREVVYNGKVIFSEDEDKRTHYEARAISRWLDWQYHQEKIDRAVEKQFGKPIKPFKIYV